MNNILKSIRDWLVKSSKHSLYEVLEEAKMTPRQMKIVEMRFVKGLTNYQIAMELNVSTKIVETEIKTAYRAVSRILDKMI